MIILDKKFIILLSFSSFFFFYDVIAFLDFANRDSNIVFETPATRFLLVNVGSIKGWTQDSIIKTYGNNPSSQWVEAYTDGDTVGAGLTPAPSNMVYNNSNAVNASKGVASLIKSSSATLVGCCTLTKQTSNAIASGNVQNLLRNNSNALIPCCTLEKQNSNAINAMTILLKTVSNAIQNNAGNVGSLANLVRQNSNAINFGVNIPGSELTQHNSQALILLLELQGVARHTSNNLVADYVIVNGNSNAILSLVASGTGGPTVAFFAQSLRNSSHAIIKNTRDINNNSNAIIVCCRLIKQTSDSFSNQQGNSSLIITTSNAVVKNVFDINNNSNAIVKNTRDINNNSNAIVKNTRDINNDSNAIVKNARDINNNSNAIVKNTRDINNSSNAILELSQIIIQTSNLLVSDTPLVIANSNAIVLTRRELGEIAFGIVPSVDIYTPRFTMKWPLFLSEKARLIIHTDTIIDGRGHFIHFANDVPGCIIIFPGRRLQLTNVMIKNFYDTGLSTTSPGSTVLYGDKTILELTDPVLTTNMTFTGNAMINGLGNVLDLSSFFIGIMQHGNLTLQDIFLRGVQNNNIRCIGNTGNIVFDDATIALNGDYSYTTGQMTFSRDVVITGPNTFGYASHGPATIARQSTLLIDQGTTLGYVPSVANRDLFTMTDSTSRLFLYGCNVISTQTGMRLTKGSLFIDHLVTLSNSAVSLSQAMAFGDGNIAHDLTIEVLPGGSLDLKSGILSYDNVA